MKMFSFKQNKVVALKEKPFKLEKEIQIFFEKNLEQLTGLELVKSEPAFVEGQRFDTLAFDNKIKAFVIIEYKRSHNYSVIDQGVNYASKLLENQAESVLKYNEVLEKSLKKNDVNWDKSKLIIVSPKFNERQKQTARLDFNPIKIDIELWEIKRFENDTMMVNRIYKSKSAPSVKQSTQLGDISREVKHYSEDEHLLGKPEEIVELYEDFKQRLLNLYPDLTVVALKQYIAFKNNNKNVVDMLIKQKSLKIYLNLKKGKLDDPKQLARDVSNISHWGNGDYAIILKDDSHIEYIMSLIKQIL